MLRRRRTYGAMQCVFLCVRVEIGKRRFNFKRIISAACLAVAHFSRDPLVVGLALFALDFVPCHESSHVVRVAEVTFSFDTGGSPLLEAQP
jgi:hypothetical protein